MRSLFLDALRCNNTSRAPVWLMRQAGRYMPEYRKIRETRSFLKMCKEPEIAAEVTLLPIKAFGMDAAIIFSDILVIPDALNVGLKFDEGKGPIIERPIASPEDAAKLVKPDLKEALGYVYQAIRYVLPELDVPLIGFAGAPFTVASYMIEGGASHDLKKTKRWMVQDPASFHALLDLITECTIEYLNHQIDAGVHALQIFDSWANVLDTRHFREFSLNYLRKIVLGLKDPKIPAILFCRGSSVFLEDLLEAKPACISLDWNIDLSKARGKVGQNTALQGNLDPDILYAPLQAVKKETERALLAMRNDRGYIFNLGHGIKPDVPVDAVKALVDTVKNFAA